MLGDPTWTLLFVHPTRISSGPVVVAIVIVIISCIVVAIFIAFAFVAGHTQFLQLRWRLFIGREVAFSRLELCLHVTVTFNHYLPTSPLILSIPLLIEVPVIHLTVSVAIWTMKTTTSREWFVNYVPTCTIIIFDLFTAVDSSTCSVVGIRFKMFKLVCI